MAKQKVFSIVANFADPGADKRILMFKVPAGVGQVQVVGARAISDTSLVEGASNVVELTLQDGGADGTGTDTVGAAITNVSGAWTAETPREFTITERLLDEGDWLVCKYNETGTVAPKNTTINVDLVLGKR